MQLFLVPVMYDRIGRNKLRALEGFITQKEIHDTLHLYDWSCQSIRI